MIEKPEVSAIHFRLATNADADILGALNAQLIQDEGHRNAMTVPELVRRMRGWLEGEYQAVLAEHAGDVVGYALFRRETEHIFLRQLFVRAANRRRGIGQRMIQWLAENVCHQLPRIRIDVLIGNHTARAFWKSMGFKEYCLTMEMDLPTPPD